MAASSNSVQSGETGLLACPSSCYKCVVSYYKRHLPHWQPEGAALFLTWRLHGSLPRTVEILEPRPAGEAFVTIDRKLDEAATGPRWLQEERVARVVVDALRYGERQLGLYHLRAWVLMIDHVHILVYPEAPLSRITKAIKNHAKPMPSSDAQACRFGRTNRTIIGLEGRRSRPRSFAILRTIRWRRGW